MADLKVTELNAITASSVVTDDVLLLVDISAGEDKKIEPDELVQAGLSLLGTEVIAGDKLTNNSVTATQIAADAIGASELADDAVDEGAIATAAVHGTAVPATGSKVHIEPASIGTADVGNNQITTAKIADDAITADQIAANAVSGSGTSLGTTHIEAGSISAADIKDASITAAKLTGGALVPTSGIIDSDVSSSADIAVSKLAAFNPNQVLAGPSSGSSSGSPTVRALVAGDLPVGTASTDGAVSVPSGGGLNISSGQISHSNSVTAADYGFFAFDAQGHITSGRALAAGDLPVATTSAIGGISIGSGLSVSGGSASLNTASTSALGGIKLSGDVTLNGSSQLEIATSGVVAGSYPKVTVTTKGIVTAGGLLADSDIPNHSAALLTSGTLDAARLGANTITGGKMANDSTCVLQTSAPTSGDFQGQFYLDTGSNSLSVWNGSSFVAVTAAALADLVADTTPQLGGDLDVNGKDIVSVSDGDIELDPNGSGQVIFKGNSTRGSGQIKLNCEQNSHGILLKGPPHSAAASYTLTLPNDTGTSGQLLQTNGSGVTSWTSTLASTGITIDGPYEQVAEAVSALDIDLNDGNYFTKTINGNSTFTFSNPPASGTVGSFVLELTHTSGTVSWPASVKFPADTAPTLTTGKTHLFFFVTDDGGTRYRGASLVDYVN